MKNLFLSSILFAVTDILVDGTGEQHGFLRNITNLAPQFLLRHLVHIHTVHTHRTFYSIIESRYHVQQRRLT